jgi:hypothetical protein
MATQVQFRRGSTSQTASFTGAAGEVTVDTSKNTCVVHDGSIAGGFPLLRQDGVNSALSSGSLSSPALKFANSLSLVSIVQPLVLLLLQMVAFSGLVLMLSRQDRYPLQRSERRREGIPEQGRLAETTESPALLPVQKARVESGRMLRQFQTPVPEVRPGVRS